MIDFTKVKPGHRLRVVDPGSNNVAKIGDIVVVTKCVVTQGMLSVINSRTGSAMHYANYSASRMLEYA